MVSNSVSSSLKELEGLAWWHGLSDIGRTYWLQVAKGTIANPGPADAWAASKRVADRAVTAAAASATYEQMNVFGSLTNIRVRMGRGQSLPAVPIGHSWALIEEHPEDY